MYEIYSKLKIKTPESRQWRRSGVFIAKFEHISHIAVVFLLMSLTKYMRAEKEYLEVAFWTMLQVQLKNRNLDKVF